VKLRPGYREATPEEHRPGSCIIVRIWNEGDEARCPDAELSGTAGLCEHHAKMFLNPEEYQVNSPSQEGGIK
jgi:hypothetical protein